MKTKGYIRGRIFHSILRCRSSIYTFFKYISMGAIPTFCDIKFLISQNKSNSLKLYKISKRFQLQFTDYHCLPMNYIAENIHKIVVDDKVFRVIHRNFEVVEKIKEHILSIKSYDYTNRFTIIMKLIDLNVGRTSEVFLKLAMRNHYEVCIYLIERRKDVSVNLTKHIQNSDNMTVELFRKIPQIFLSTSSEKIYLNFAITFMRIMNLTTELRNCDQ